MLGFIVKSQSWGLGCSTAELGGEVHPDYYRPSSAVIVLPLLVSSRGCALGEQFPTMLK